MPSYVALYKSKSGTTLVVRTLTPPPEKRKFNAGGLRTFYLVKSKYHLQEVIIMAKSAKAAKNKKKTVADDELDELEGIEELDELEDDDEDEVEDDEPEDEDEDEDEDDDDEDDEVEEKPAKKKGSSKPKQSRAAKDGLIGSQEAAEFVGAKDARELRMVLRKLREKDASFAPDPETNRYQWKSLKDPQLKKIKKAFESGLHTKIKDEALNKLKASQAEKKAAESKDASTKTKKGKKNKKKASSDDDE